MMNALPKPIIYYAFGLYFLLFVVAVTAATIQHTSSTTRIDVEQDSRLLSSSSTSSYQKSGCIPRAHDYDNSDATTHIPAPDVFRVQMTLTTTTVGGTHSIDTTTSSTKISTLTMQFNRTWSPLGVDRLYQMVLDHYLDCAVFFRVVPGTSVPVPMPQHPGVTRECIRHSNCSKSKINVDSRFNTNSLVLLLFVFSNWTMFVVRLYHPIWYRLRTG